MQRFPIIVKTLFGLESVLAAEMEQAGFSQIKILNRAVRFEGDMESVYKSNLMLRTALKVLIPVEEFDAADEEDLYRQIKRMPWQDYLDTSQTFAISANVSGEVFRHSKYVSLKAKDAIVDRFREKSGRRPSVSTDQPDVEINLYIHKHHVTVSLDSTGVSLDRRGYRLSRNEAPINEVLAAGILLMADISSFPVVYDPMCGSGTFSIEAAMILSHTAPGLGRNFSFQNWGIYDETLFKSVHDELSKNQTDTPVKILARDTDKKALNITAENAERAGMDEFISLKHEDFTESSSLSDKGVLLLNPPYGERMLPEKTDQLYKAIGDTLKQRYKGHEAWIISSNAEAMKAIGLKPASRKTLFNGALECRLQKYELYEGTRRPFR